MSVRSGLSSQPPLVCFIAGLSLMAVSLVGLVLTIQLGERIQNPDVPGWDDFLTQLTDLELCVSNETWRPMEGVSSGNRSRISLWVPMSTPSGLAIAGSVRLAALRATRAEYGHEVATVSFTVPAGDPADPTGLMPTRDVCLTVEAPESLINAMNRSQQPPRPCQPSLGEAQFRAQVETEPCRNATAQPWAYDPHPEWVVWIDDTDRRVISLHMLCTAAFLVAVAGSAILVAFIRGRPKTRSGGDERGHRTLVGQRDNFDH